MPNKKISLTPSRKGVEDFIKAANTEADTVYPWNDPKVRDDVIKSVNLRMPEEYVIKLQWISEQMEKPQQALMREALLPYIDEKIRQIIGT
jgi:hypothetical protein